MNITKVTNAIFAFGAAIVVLGAYLKITHKSFADEMLGVGLITEVALFMVLGFQEIFGKGTSEEETKFPKVMDNSDLSDNIHQLNKTIKKVFNQ